MTLQGLVDEHQDGHKAEDGPKQANRPGMQM